MSNVVLIMTAYNFHFLYFFLLNFYPKICTVKGARNNPRKYPTVLVNSDPNPK